MGRKSFKQKEQEFLSKSQVQNEVQSSNVFIREKSEREIAFEYLQKKGLPVCYQNNVLYCLCSDEQEYERFHNLLMERYNGDIPFSFGAKIGVCENALSKKEYSEEVTDVFEEENESEEPEIDEDKDYEQMSLF